MSVRDVFKWGGAGGTEKELVRASKLNAISQAFGRSRCLGYTTPNYAFDTPTDGFLHIYRLLSPYIRVTLMMDASASGSTTVSVYSYDGAGGKTGAAHDSASFSYTTGNTVGTYEIGPLPTDEELVVEILDGSNMTITCALVWEMPKFATGTGSLLPLG